MTGDYLWLDLSTSEKYRKFLNFALNRADCIALSYTSDLSAFKESKWRAMFGESFLKGEYDGSGNLTVYLKTDHVTFEWLKSKRDIFDFTELDEDEQYLWDLCLIKNGVEFFTTISHEEQMYVDEKFYSEYKQYESNSKKDNVRTAHKFQKGRPERSVGRPVSRATASGRPHTELKLRVKLGEILKFFKLKKRANSA